MLLQNADIAGKFYRIADLLEIKGENPFRIRSYRNAARTLESMSKRAAELAEEDFDFSRIKGIGKDLDHKIKELIRTGRLPLLSNLEKELPPGLPELMDLPGLGGKRVKPLYQDLNIQNLPDLKKAAEKGNVRNLPGFGKKTEEKILEEIRRKEKAGPERMRLDRVESIAETVLEHLHKHKGIARLEPAGSIRRRKETVGDLDILAAGETAQGLMDHFVKYDEVERVLAKGKTKTSVVLHSGLQLDLRLVPEKSFGAALVYFTGSKAHNIHLRKLAVGQGLKISEYGVYRGPRQVAGRTEQDVYQSVGLSHIPPELREDQGEIEAAEKNKLPRLVEQGDLRGDLHMHTTASDGHASLREMVEAARKLGYEYVGSTEHSQRLTVAKGLDPGRLAKHIAAIDRLNKKLKGITVLKGIEVDILEEGSLDLPDESLEKLDFVIASVHYKFNLDADRQTERIIRAMDNPLVSIIGHPTGRMINERQPYALHMDKVIRVAAERGCMLELDAHPERLDLTDAHCRSAKEAGVRVAIDTDAHSPADYGNMRFGLGQARRGWLEKEDVANTRSLAALRKLFKRK